MRCLEEGDPQRSEGLRRVDLFTQQQSARLCRSAAKLSHTPPGCSRPLLSALLMRRDRKGCRTHFILHRLTKQDAWRCRPRYRCGNHAWRLFSPPRNPCARNCDVASDILGSGGYSKLFSCQKVGLYFAYLQVYLLWKSLAETGPQSSERRRLTIVSKGQILALNQGEFKCVCADWEAILRSDCRLLPY